MTAAQIAVAKTSAARLIAARRAREAAQVEITQRERMRLHRAWVIQMIADCAKGKS
jgi:hypothetical protein